MCLYIYIFFIELKVNSKGQTQDLIRQGDLMLHRNRMEDASWIENVHENIQHFVFMLAFAFILSSSGRGHVDICSLPTKSRKSLAHDVFDTFATNVCLVDDKKSSVN